MNAITARFILPFLAAWAFACSTANAAAGWDVVNVGKQRYVTVDSIKKFYKFQNLAVSGNKLTLTKNNVRVELRVGQQDVWMNGIKFYFSYPVRRSSGRPIVHLLDLTKTLHPVMWPHNLRKYSAFDTVIIDPGHGGRDPGTMSRHGSGVEKDHALSVALKLRTQLRKRGFKVGMTRDSDRYLSLQQRVDYANKIPSAIFISIHFNSGGNGRAKGIETFTLSPKGVAHYGRGLKASDFSNKAGNVNDPANVALATAIHSNCIKRTARVDRGIRRARYSVISGVKHPAILLEGGFLSNREEGRLIANKAYHDRLALAVAEAVVKYKIATSGKRAGQ